MKKKSIKLKDLLPEHTLFLGIKANPAMAFVPTGYTNTTYKQPIKEDEDDFESKKRLLFGQSDEEQQEITDEMKQAFQEIVGQYAEYGKGIYRERKLKEITETILNIGKLAEKIALAETDDWFDTMTVQRDMKGLNESVKLFEKTAKDLNILQQRLESLYEDIGTKLSRYYEIRNIAEMKNYKKKVVAEAAGDLKKLVGKSEDDELTLSDASSIGKKDRKSVV